MFENSTGSSVTKIRGLFCGKVVPDKITTAAINFLIDVSPVEVDATFIPD